MQVLHGDCIEVLRDMEDCSVDAIVTDPPYRLSQVSPAKVAETLQRWANGERDFVPTGRGFMSAARDGFVPPPAVWDEVLRVLKPGGHAAVFAGSRTQDLMGMSIRMAGFQIKDSLAWIHGSGMPKGLSVEKAVESHLASGKSNSRSLRVTEQAGDGESYTLSGRNNGILGENRTYARKTLAATTEEAQQWTGWSTQLKPALEPILLAQKPLVGTVAKNVLEHGVGGLNVDACRIGTSDDTSRKPSVVRDTSAPMGLGIPMGGRGSTSGRFPPNVLLDDHAAEVLGDRSKFFPGVKYQAKASKSERPTLVLEDGSTLRHPTVKPLDLMSWIVRLICPDGGRVLDPFAGSGTTLQAAQDAGMRSIGIEQSADYLRLIEKRLSA